MQKNTLAVNSSKISILYQSNIKMPLRVMLANFLGFK